MPFLWFFNRSATTPTARRRPRRLGVERLEHRDVPATFLVQNLNDVGPGSLRQALLDANATPAADTIQFAVSGSIAVTGPALPAVTAPVVLDASTAPGFAGTPVVEIDFQGTAGLRLLAGSTGSTVRGLGLVHALGAGILVIGDNNTLAGNYIGIDLDGTTANPNGTHGVELWAASTGNTIGTSAAADRNVISGNQGAGVAVLGSSHNRIQGNYIGTDYTGAVDVGNRGSGVVVTNQARYNLLGGNGLAVTYGAMPIDGNLISGNDGSGVLIIGGSSFNTLSGNFIGTTIAGTVALGNGGDGVTIASANYNSLIGTYRNQPPFVFYNVISGNHGNGVRVRNANNTVIQANYLGLGSDDATPVGNQLSGLVVEGTSATTTFGGVIPLGNVAAANGMHGVEIRDRVSGFVAFNTFAGIGSFSLLTTLGNRLDGFHITTTGGGIVLRTNVISANGDDGVEVSGLARGVQLVQNIIGMNTTGGTPMGNADNGIEVGGQARGIVIGGLQPDFSVIPHNVISGNLGNGVAVVGAAWGTKINFSYIGTNTLGTSAFGNGKAGVYLGPGTSHTLVGSRLPALRTVISGNTLAGVEIRGSSDNTVVGCVIGLDGDGVLPMGNLGSGVEVVSGYRNRIGTTQLGAGNVIAHNHEDGVRLVYGRCNSVRGNDIYDNLGRGISLSLGANQAPPPPVLTSALPATGNQVRIRGTATAAAFAWVSIDFYVNFDTNAPGTPEGRVYIGSMRVRADAAGVARFLFTAYNPPPGAQLFTATQTTAIGDTSEFSAAVATPGS